MSRENQTGDGDRKQLNAELESLRQEVSRLQHENRDLELALLTTTEHGDFVEAELDQLNRQLQAEIDERQLAQAKLQSILDMLWRDKTDLEIMLTTATEHGDTVEYELYKQVVASVEQLQEQARLSELQVEERTAELKQTSAELRGLFAAMTDVIVVYDRQGQCIKVAPTNPRLLLDPPTEEIVMAYETLSVQILDRQISCIHQVLASRQTQNLEYCLAIDGQEVWFSANVSPLSEDTVIWVARDISDRKQAELDLRRAKEEAELASRQRGEFLASMSHELRTPLNAILGFAQLMGYDESISEDHQESLTIIRQSGEHLLTLINDILEMSKLESGRVPLHRRDFDLHNLLHAIREMLMLKASSKDLQMLLEIDKDVPRYIRTDEGRLRQVLINLLSNAIKFTQDGSVILRVSLVDREETQEEVYLAKMDNAKIESSNDPIISSLLVRFEVEDTGEGIAPEEMSKLFEPFVQAASGRRSKEGTGLGLAISRKLVRMLGGDITLTSTVNVGTTFSFCIEGIVALESSIEQDISCQRIIELEEGQPQFRILLAEDIKKNRQFLSKTLTQAGFEVREAINGKEVIAIWQEWSPQLIWMDMQMPIVAGDEATRQIRLKEKELANNGFMRQPPTKIIALTASAFEEEREEVFAAGCDDLVGKPISRQTVLEKVAEHLGARYHYIELPNSEIPNTELNTNSQGSRLERSPLLLTRSDLLVMPSDWITQLYTAAIRVDASQIHQLIDEIPPQHQFLATMLIELLNEFRFDIIFEATSEFF
ncbi:hypothetical protein TUMEXPCC7403_05445 [Tumidithrix helvetica PCC 7403]|uniref:ATP-binding protein n=1 Tax=Tumidithrix helvetica TaxID=3457545 RepID=UPI003CAEA5FD